MVIVESGRKLDLFANSLLQGKDGVEGEVCEIKIFVGVLFRGIGAEDEPVKD